MLAGWLACFATPRFSLFAFDSVPLLVCWLAFLHADLFVCLFFRFLFLLVGELVFHMLASCNACVSLPVCLFLSCLLSPLLAFLFVVVFDLLAGCLLALLGFDLLCFACLLTSLLC